MIYVIIKRNVLDNVRNVEIRFVLNVSRIITKTVNSCPEILQSIVKGLDY